MHNSFTSFQTSGGCQRKRCESSGGIREITGWGSEGWVSVYGSREGKGRRCWLLGLNVAFWHWLARPADCCGEGAPDGTGVLSCVIIDWVLLDRGGWGWEARLVCCYLLAFVWFLCYTACGPCRVRIWTSYLSLSIQLIDFRAGTYGLLGRSLSV